MEEILICVLNGEITPDEAKELLIDTTDCKESSINTVLKMVSKGLLPLSKALGMLGYIPEEDNPTPNKKKGRGHKKRTSRPIEHNEFVKILRLCTDGFTYVVDNKSKKFRANKKLAMVFMLQANLGLRIGDVLTLKPSTFKNDKLEVIEKKTGKLQYRDIHPNLKNLIYEYSLDNNIKQNDYIINLKRAGVHKQLKIIVNYLKFTNVSSHSFRKMYAVKVYEQTNDIDLLKELLNHSDVSTTQRYLRVSQKKIDDVSASIDFTKVLDDCN